MNGSRRPIRVLHIIGALNRGGTETWLVNLLKRVDPNDVQMDFMVQQQGDPALEREVRENGSRIISVQRDIRWPIRFARALRQYGPYDIIHSHRNMFSAVVLLIAKMAVPAHLIAHSHTSMELDGTWRRRFLMLGVGAVRKALNRLADVRLATSRQASIFLFGEVGDLPEGARVIFCGVDVDGLVNSRDEARRDKHTTPSGVRTKTVGHVGAFKPVKNHAFMLDVLEQLVQLDPDWRLVLIGDGPLRSSVEREVRSRGLSNYVLFKGPTGNVAGSLATDIDVFLFPSKFEGLGLALVEAQIVGLPCVASDVVPEQAIVYPDRVALLSLSRPSADWAKQVVRAYEMKDASDWEEDLASIRQFDIAASAETLVSIYQSMCLGIGNSE